MSQPVRITNRTAPSRGDALDGDCSCLETTDSAVVPRVQTQSAQIRLRWAAFAPPDKGATIRRSQTWLGQWTSDETIYTKHKDDLIRYATVLVGSGEAEDVLSMVVLKTLERRSLADLDDARAYLFRAISNEAKSGARRRRTAEAVPVPPASSVQLAEPDDEVAAALRTLPPRQLAAVFLVYWEDLTIKDAARTLGASTGTVKRYLYLARRKLKGLIDHD